MRVRPWNTYGLVRSERCAKHIWTNRPLGYWPQGIPRPEPLKTPIEKLPWNGTGVNARLANSFAGSYPIPESLAWDLFLGPAPYVEYHPIYHPFNWRGWVDWGNGPLGDMRSEEHTSELQSLRHLVCRLLLEKKKRNLT